MPISIPANILKCKYCEYFYTFFLTGFLLAGKILSLYTHLCLMKSHVVAHNMELHSPGASVTFDPVCVES